jgi:hydrogenase maturation protease
MTDPRILIACVGNIFLGDDGFGVEVARRLLDRQLPSEVLVKDFGIRGLDLTYALLNPYEVVILVDACPRGGTPGTVYLVEPDLLELNALNSAPASLEAHSMNPMSVLRVVKSMGGALGRVLIVGCEPAEFGSDSDEGGKLGLSDSVESAVEEAVAMVERLTSNILAGLSTEQVLQLQ